MARGRLVALVLSLGLGVASACSNETGSNKPLGSGDKIIVDVDASDLPPQPDAEPDDVFAQDEMRAAYADGSALFTVCAPPDGGKAKASAGDASAYGDAGAAAACQPIPAACTGNPTCDCLFKAFASQIPCPYPHCGVQDGFNIYCP